LAGFFYPIAMPTVKLHGLVSGIQDDLFTGLSSNLLFKPIED
jgi:hypothetical protein